MKKIFSLIFIFVIILSSLFTFGFIPKVIAQSWTDITLPYSITTAGNYRITADYIGSDAVALYIANNTVIDGQGHTINMLNQGEAISITNKMNFEIYNLTITNAHVNMLINGVVNGYIHDFTISSSNWGGTEWNNVNNFTFSNSVVFNNTVDAGVAFDQNSNDFKVDNVTFYGNSQALRISSSYNYTLQNNLLYSNTYAINNANSNESIINNNILQQNSGYNLRLYQCNNALVYNNLFNSTTNIGTSTGSSNLFFNTTMQLGSRIYGNGDYIGGNYWVGYSTPDTNGDGFVDTAYNTVLTYYDYLPLSDNGTSTPTPTPTPTITPTPTPMPTDTPIPTPTPEYFNFSDANFIGGLPYLVQIIIVISIFIILILALAIIVKRNRRKF